MRSPVAGLAVALVAAVLAMLGVGAQPALAAPASAATPLTPVEGAIVSGHAGLTWTEVVGPGYEVRWNADGAVDADGVLDPALGGRAFPQAAAHVLMDLTAPTYHWQVRALPAGEWSAVATFHVDVQLDTLDVPEAAETGSPSEPPLATPPPVEEPDSAPPPLGGPLHGLLWVAGASSLAGLILAVVGREWLRLQRQPRDDAG